MYDRAVRRALVVFLGLSLAACSSAPTPTPTPTPSPAPAPSPAPTPAPTPAPSPAPTPAPSPAPSPAPTPAPSPAPTPAPTPTPPTTTGNGKITGNLNGADNVKFYVNDVGAGTTSVRANSIGALVASATIRGDGTFLLELPADAPPASSATLTGSFGGSISPGANFNCTTNLTSSVAAARGNAISAAQIYQGATTYRGSLSSVQVAADGTITAYTYVYVDRATTISGTANCAGTVATPLGNVPAAVSSNVNVALGANWNLVKAVATPGALTQTGVTYTAALSVVPLNTVVNWTVVAAQ